MVLASKFVETCEVSSTEGAAAVRFSAQPAHLLLRPGATIRIPLRVTLASALQGTAPATGAVVVEPIGAQPLRVPWAITFGRPRRDLLGEVALEPSTFAPSDVRPALLTVVATMVAPGSRCHSRGGPSGASAFKAIVGSLRGR